MLLWVLMRENRSILHLLTRQYNFTFNIFCEILVISILQLIFKPITMLIKDPKPEMVYSKPYCQCCNKKSPVPWTQLSECSCGEDNEVSEWGWEQPEVRGSSWVVVSENKKQVTFHPFYSSGTAAVRGDTPFVHNYHYYWEVKILTETYGTDIMVGLGTDKVNLADAQFKFTSLLGNDVESYGLSYTGLVRHNEEVQELPAGFCRGTIVGVRVDMWRGTVEFYLNRKPQGISFDDIRRHQVLYPMVCSTAAQSSMRLIYASSWHASLLVDAAKILAASLNKENKSRLPPGLRFTVQSQFWLMQPSDTANVNGEKDEVIENGSAKMNVTVPNEVLPRGYMNGFYVDNVDRDYRVVVWEQS